MQTDIVSTLVTALVIVMCACAVGAVITYILQRVFEVERKKRKPRRHQSATAIMEAIANAVPQSTTSAEESELALARAGVKMSPAALWAVRLVCAAAFMALGLAVGIKSGNLVGVVAGPALGVLAGVVLPQIVLMSRRKQWQENIDRDLPNALDLMCVSMKAGSTFTSALRTVARRTEGDLAEGLTDVCAAAEFQPPTTALKRFADNAGVSSLTLFVASIIQAEQSGMALADVLESQAESVRTQRRLKLEEQINKLPVKMTMPCMLIFLAMLIIVLAPPVAQVASLAGVIG